MEEKIRQLIEEELARANEKFPGFASAHEGYAVLLEEVEEAQEDLDTIKIYMEALWKDVRGSGGNSFNHDLRYILGIASRLTEESIQVAAMSQKFINFLKSQANG